LEAVAKHKEEEEGLKDGSIVLSQFGETPTISTAGGGGASGSGQPASSLSPTFSGRREEEEEKVSEEEKMKEIAQDFPMDHPSISSSSQSNLIASNMAVTAIAATVTAAAISAPRIKNKKKKSKNKIMKDPTKLSQQDIIPPPVAADLGNTNKDTAGYTIPYHTATTKRPQVMSAAGDVFSDDMSHHSLERFTAEFGPIDTTTTTTTKIPRTKSKRTKKEKMNGQKTKKQELQQQKQQKSTRSNTQSMSRAGDIAVPANTTVDIPHDPPESIDDDLTIDSVLKKDHERDPTNIDRSNIPKTKKNKYDKNKKGDKRGFFGSWFNKSKRKVKEGGGGSSTKKSSSRGSGKKSSDNQKDTNDAVVPVIKFSKSQKAKCRRGNKRSAMTLGTEPTSSRRVAAGGKGVAWKREISTKSDACLMHEEERVYDEAPIIAH